MSMKKINLDKIEYSLKTMNYKVKVPEDIRIRAKKALDKMLEVA